MEGPGVIIARGKNRAVKGGGGGGEGSLINYSIKEGCYS